MAEGGEITLTPSSVYEGSDEVFDVICDPCSRLGNTSEALDFCSDCAEYFCPACTKDHLKFGITSGHKVVKRSEANQTGQAKTSPRAVPTERCDDHNGELITTYCADHGAVACNSCVSMDHRLCDNIYYIPSVSGDPHIRKCVPQVKDEMAGSLKSINVKRRNIQQLKHKADEEKSKHLKHINDRTEQLIKHAREMEQAAVNDVRKRHKETTDTLVADLASLDKAEARITTRIESLDKADTTSDSQVFVDTKMGMRDVDSARQLEHRLEFSGTGDVKSTFVVDDRVDSFLSDVSSLGKVVVPYRAVLKGSYTVRAKGDNLVCDIADIHESSDGNILMTDYKNSRIKALDTSYMLVESFKMSSPPWGICETSQHEIAVTLPNAKKVQFVDTRGSWKQTRSFPVELGGRGIALSNDELFVSYGGIPGNAQASHGTVAVYDMSGSLRRKIQLDSHGRPIFSVPYHIVPTNNGRKINVVDKDLGVLTTDRQGNILSTFSRNGAWSVGLCSVDGNNLLFSEKFSKSILQISTDGQLVAELLRKDGKTRACAMNYSRKTSTLVVAFDASDEINVFHLSS